MELLEYIAQNIAGKSFCPFGEASVWGMQSNLAKFRHEFLAHIEKTNPSSVGPEIPIRPIYRPDTHQPSGLRQNAQKSQGERIVLHDEFVAGD